MRASTLVKTLRGSGERSWSAGMRNTVGDERAQRTMFVRCQKLNGRKVTCLICDNCVGPDAGCETEGQGMICFGIHEGVTVERSRKELYVFAATATSASMRVSLCSELRRDGMHAESDRGAYRWHSFTQHVLTPKNMWQQTTISIIKKATCGAQGANPRVVLLDTRNVELGKMVDTLMRHVRGV